jgi:hypothetical protein
MSVPVQLASVLLVLIVSASAHVTVIGQPVPVLWLIAAAVVLVLAAIVIVLIRSIVRDRAFLYLRPRMVNQ